MLSFTQAAMKFFGKKEGQTLVQFSMEIKELNDKDREELAPLLAKELGDEVSPKPFLKS